MEELGVRADPELESRYFEILSQIRRCERECGRKEGEVALLAAVKYASAGQIEQLCELGLRDMGENRSDKLEADLPLIAPYPSVRMHFIGTLQTRKAKEVVPRVALIHSIDSKRLADAVAKAAAAAGVTSGVLIEINVASEESKSGALPDEAPELAEYVASLPGLSLEGFMTMGRAGLTPEGHYDEFSAFARLSREIWSRLPGREGKPYLSMGMSESFEPAIAAGSDCVRIGRALFGHPAV